MKHSLAVGASAVLRLPRGSKTLRKLGLLRANCNSRRFALASLNRDGLWLRRRPSARMALACRQKRPHLFDRQSFVDNVEALPGDGRLSKVAGRFGI